MSDKNSDLNKALEILRRCLVMTEKGKLEWESRPQRPDCFETDLPSGNIEIGTEDDDGAPPHDLRIFSPGTEGYVRLFTISGRENPELEPDLQDLWGKANRFVLGVESNLDALLDDLREE